MKYFKRIVLVCSLIAVLCLTAVSAFALNGGISDFSVSFNTGVNQVQIKWWAGTDAYYLFMPSDAPLGEVKAEFTASSDVTFNGNELKNGDVLNLDTQTDYVLSCDGNEYILKVLQSEDLPSLHITTESGSMDSVNANKSYKEQGDIVILSEGEVIVDRELNYIKGRGNYTWTLPKKPYNIKFNNKISLFGMEKAKKWTLLANCYDNTIIRNATAFDLAENVGLDFTSEYVSVDLYINKEYYGNYLLCESVEVGDGRVEIEDLEGNTEDVNEEDLDTYDLGGVRFDNYRNIKAGTQKWVNIPNDPENITGGYLLEYEYPTRYNDEVSGFVTDRSQTIILKSPEYASEAQVKYISSYYQEFEDAVNSENGYNSLGKHYTEYIDVDSFVKMYVFQEFVKNLDAALTSFYIYKDADSDKFVAGPVWDFDKALGANEQRYGSNISYPTGWWAGVIYYSEMHCISDVTPTVLNALYKQDDFFSLACDEWQNTFSRLINASYINTVSEKANALSSSAVMNGIRWSCYGTTEPESVSTAYKAYVKANLLDFMSARKDFLDKAFSDTSVRVFYNSNSGKGIMFNSDAVVIGDELVLPSCTFTHSSLVFSGWNTLPDGKGESYKAGDRVTLDSEKITFYAQWEEKNEDKNDTTDNNDNTDDNCNHICHSENGFMKFIWKVLCGIFKIFKVNEICKCGIEHY